MAQQYKTDVAVYGRGLCAMAAAVGAQIALAPIGGNAKMFMPTPIMGGDAANGLMNWDFGPRDILYRGSWIGAEFFKRVLTRYGSSNYAYRFLSRHNIEVAWEMIRWYGVQVLPSEQISAVTLSGALPAAITQLTFASGDTVVPRGASMVVIEADSDNVDLGRLAFPAGFAIGRESQGKYGEPNAGYGQFNPAVTTVPTVYLNDGVTLQQGYRLNPVGATVGEGDGTWANTGGSANITVPCIQPPAFRAPLARKKDGWAQSWVPTPNYNPQNFAIAIQFPQSLTFPITSAATQGVFDRNFDLPAQMAVDWANGTWAQRGQPPYSAVRGAIYDKMVEFEYDYFYFLANDPSVNAQAQATARLWGPLSDEFFNTGVARSPYEPYIRESYNMLANFIMTQQYINVGGVTRSDGISVASYSIDIHTCAKFVTSSTTFLTDNGFNNMPGINDPGSTRLTKPYQITWNQCIFNPATGVTNYINAWNDGSSHIARGSNRMVPAKIYQGSACGYIAGRSIALSTPLASMNIPNMQTEMVALGHVVTPPTV